MATLFGMAYNFAPDLLSSPIFHGSIPHILEKALTFQRHLVICIWSQAHVDWTHTLQQQAMVNHCCISFLNLYLSYLENPVMSLLTHAYALQESEPTQWHVIKPPHTLRFRSWSNLEVSTCLTFVTLLYPCLVQPCWSLCLKHRSSSLHSQSLDLDWSITPFLSPQTDFT